MISSTITRINTFVLAAAGLALLFAADNILPALIVSFPREGFWLGQILAAALLGLANFNWFNRDALIGGIYGRPVVASNTTFYFVAAMVLVRTARASGTGPGFWIVTAVAAVFAVLYGWLMFRGPFERDLQVQRGTTPLAPNETNTTIRS